MDNATPQLVRDLGGGESPFSPRTVYVRVVGVRTRLLGSVDYCFLRVDDSSGYPLRSVQLKCPLPLLACHGFPEPRALVERPARLLCTVQRSHFPLPDAVEYGVVRVLRVDTRGIVAAEIAFWRTCIRARARTRAQALDADADAEAIAAELEPGYLDTLRDRDEAVQVLSSPCSSGGAISIPSSPGEGEGDGDVSVDASSIASSPWSSPWSSPARSRSRSPTAVPTRPGESYTAFVACVLRAARHSGGIAYTERLFVAQDTQRVLRGACAANPGCTMRQQYDAWVERLVRDGLARWSHAQAQGSGTPALKTGVLRRLHGYARRRVRLMRQVGSATLPVDVPQILRKLRMAEGQVRARGVLEAFRVVLRGARGELGDPGARDPGGWWIEGGGEHWVVHLEPQG